MPGIFGTNIENNEEIMEKQNRIYNIVKNNEWYLELSSIKKFENDKILNDKEFYTVLIDGVILNLNQLKTEYNESELDDLIVKMYNELGDEFFKCFRGNFCGFFEDKLKQKTLIFTNQTGDKTIFFYNNNDKIIFASEIKHILKFMKQNKINHNLDERGVYSLITYGYMYDNLTLIKEIKRLLPGYYIKIENETIEQIQYYKLKNTVIDSNETEAQIIKNIDKKFKNAVKLQIEKNNEYAYDNYAPLSAGLDSRMTNYVMKEITNKPIYNITYSQTSQLDNKIPEKISAELKNHWIFKNLDNGLALYNIEDSLDFTDGIIYYAWPSQLYDFMKIINIEKMGIVHTGVIGDVVIGTYLRNFNVSINCDTEKYMDFGYMRNIKLVMVLIQKSLLAN